MEPQKRLGILLPLPNSARYPAASLWNRAMAKAIDITLFFAIFFIGNFFFPWLGTIPAFCYALFHDGLGLGQSLGKRMLGIQVIQPSIEMPCSFFSSFLRNFILGLSVILLTFDGGGFFSGLIFLPWFATEFWLLMTLETHQRVGDVFANTSVVEYPG